MQLASFTVSNFRSITAAKKVPLTDYSVLVGANNEGKSNVLHALAMGMQVIDGFKHMAVRDSLGRIRNIRKDSVSGIQNSYEWRRDFPLSLQQGNKEKLKTEVTLEFKFSNNEVESFQNEIGSRLNGTLPILIKFSAHDIEILISKPGRGNVTLNKKKRKITDFISKKITFDYIPAIRTPETAQKVLANFLTQELNRMKRDEIYRDAFNTISKVQDDILSNLSKSITESISSLLPSVKAIDVRLNKPNRITIPLISSNSLNIEVDDGNRTPLDQKGDGVKSLVVLALMHYASNAASSSSNSIFAIEEPEAHLHPQAIHEIRNAMAELSTHNQVVLTSHSPLLINPAKIESTIVVQKNKAAIARNIAEVRNVLGVRNSDNLQSARLVALVEGETDITILTSILKSRYSALAPLISSRELVFDSLKGASNLTYKAILYNNSATAIQCLLDNDSSGICCVNQAIAKNAIRHSDYYLIRVGGKNESEIEDILNLEKFNDEFFTEFGVNISNFSPRMKKKKWSDVMEDIFLSNHKIWNDSVKSCLKNKVAKIASENIEHVIIESRIHPIDYFFKSIINRLGVNE